jgi:hypothetical protein
MPKEPQGRKRSADVIVISEVKAAEETVLGSMPSQL